MSAQQVMYDYFRKLEGKLLDEFNFTRAGHEESIGKDAAGIVAQGIIDRSVNDQGGAAGAWLPNDPDYTAEKARKYGVELIGFRTGQMISLPSLLGNVDVEPDTVTIRYGTGQPPREAMSSSYISKGDQAVTDTQKAGYFTEKKGPFFEWDEPIARAVREHMADELVRFIGELNSR